MPTSIVVKNPCAALNIVLQLLRTVSVSTLNERKASRKVVLDSAVSDWPIETLSRIWTVVSHGADQYNHVLLPPKSLRLFLDVMACLSRVLTSENHNTPRTRYLCVSIFTSLTVILASSPLPLHAALEKVLADNLLAFGSAVLAPAAISGTPKESGFQLLENVVRDQSRFSMLKPDLQVDSST